MYDAPKREKLISAFMEAVILWKHNPDSVKVRNRMIQKRKDLSEYIKDVERSTRVWFVIGLILLALVWVMSLV